MPPTGGCAVGAVSAVFRLLPGPAIHGCRMKRKIKFLILLGLCFISVVLLSRGAQWLDKRSHPLVSSLTCIETADPADLYWKINRAGAGVSIVPDEPAIEHGRYPFRFERPGSDKLAWLRKHTLPVIADCATQWNAFLALRQWVHQQIPNKYPAIKSRWDAQHILQAVWNDPSLGFICDAYAATYVSACISVGLNARMIHLGDENYNGHYATEVWSDEHGKWIFMDPLYDAHYSLGVVPLSAIELHQLWKGGGMDGMAMRGQGGATVKMGAPSRDYANLFQDIQLINRNDFLTVPFTSVLDLLTLRIRFLRYVDESNPPYNRLKLAARIFAFYYVPIFIAGVIIPFVIPAMLLLMILKLGKKAKSP